MLTLKQRKDGFRLLLPDDFIPKEINEKYTRILSKKRGFFTKPIDFLNETIQNVQVLGIQNATMVQQQTTRGTEEAARTSNRIPQNKFMHTSSEEIYRSQATPLALLDKTVNVGFRHTLGYLNYFILFESFWWNYARDQKADDMVKQFNIDMLDNTGQIYARLVLDHPVIQSIDMLDLDFTQPVGIPEQFKVVFQYSNFDLQLIEYVDDDDNMFDEIVE